MSYFNSMIRILTLLAALLPLVVASPAQADKKYVIKFATLAP